MMYLQEQFRRQRHYQLKLFNKNRGKTKIVGGWLAVIWNFRLHSYSLTAYPNLTLTPTLTVFQASAVPTPNHARVTFLLLNSVITETSDFSCVYKCND